MTTRTFVTTALITAAALPSSVSVSAQSITIRGIVVDGATGEPIAGASVGVRDSRQIVGTNTSGGFVLSGVNPGALLEVSQLGYATHIQHVDSSATLRIELAVNPIVMDRLEAVTDRLAERWRASAVASRRYNADQIMATPVFNARDFAHMRASFGACPNGIGSCVWRRGRWVQPRVFVDDIPYCSDLEALVGIPTHELHLFEIVGGTQLYVYTKQFAERLALGRVRLMPRTMVYSGMC